MFGWTDLLNDCMGSIHLETNSEWINLTGNFYGFIVSPLSDIGDTAFYRVYQLISHPFAVSVVYK